MSDDSRSGGDVLSDPSLPLVVGTSVTWESVYHLAHRRPRHCRDGRRISARPVPGTMLLATSKPGANQALDELQPNAIALNY